MQQTFLPAFESVVRDAKIRGVMCAYNSVDGVPLCANSLLKEKLRGTLGFEEGIVITDCGAIGFMTSNHKWAHANGTLYSSLEATAATLRAGTDLNCGDAYAANLPAALEAGMVNHSEIDRAVGRVLTGHFELGLFSDAKTAATDSRRNFSMSIVDSPAHRALAKKAAIEGTVLLKNDGHALPLAKPSRVAVVGPNANRTLTLTSNYAGCKDKAGGPILPSCTFVNPLQGIQAAVAAAGGEVAYAQGVEVDSQNRSGIPAAVAAAKDADVVVVVAGLITCQEVGAMCQEAEARDRSTPVNADGTDNPWSTADIGRDYGIGLPGVQQDLLKELANATAGTDTKIILVVMSGSAVAVPFAAASPQVSAIVQLFYPGVLGGEALADVLFGIAAPGGKLPVMIPTGESQLPEDYLDQSMTAGQGRTHRYFSGVPLFDFGFGLSYSTFTYSGLAVSHTSLVAGSSSDVESAVIAVSVSVTNNGEWQAADCSEIVMVFARPVLAAPPTETMSVPKQTLVGFAKVRLSPRETRRVQIDVPARSLRLVGPDGRHELLEGRYELFVGGHSPRDARAGGTSPLLRQDLVVVEKGKKQ